MSQQPYRLSADEVLSEQQSGIEGLSPEEAQARLRAYGANELDESHASRFASIASRFASTRLATEASTDPFARSPPMRSGFRIRPVLPSLPGTNAKSTHLFPMSTTERPYKAASAAPAPAITARVFVPIPIPIYE